MDKRSREVVLNPKPLKVDTDWRVVAHYPSGEVERIRGFQTEAEALQWINDASGAWPKKRGYDDG
jgi:hypothetical protein